MKKKLLNLLVLPCLLFSCSKISDTDFEEHQNIDKPVVFYGTPVLKENKLNSSYTLDYDKDVLTFNDKTLYVGLDYEKLASLQADMIYNYIEENKATINRKNKSTSSDKDNNILSYIIVTDDNSSLLSRMKIRAIRKRLGTLTTIKDKNEEQLDCGTDVSIKQMGYLSFVNDDKTSTDFQVEEAYSIEMKNQTSSVEYVTRKLFQDREGETSSRPIDFIVTISDKYSLACYNNFAKTQVPIFGFGGSAEALKAMGEKATYPYAGTVYVNNSYLAYMKMRTLENMLEGRNDFYEYGIIKIDDTGSYLKNGKDYIEYKDDADGKKLLLSGRIVNKANYNEYANYEERKNFDSTNNYKGTKKHKVFYNRILTSPLTYGDSYAEEINDYEYTYEQKYFDMLNLEHNNVLTMDDLKTAKEKQQVLTYSTLYTRHVNEKTYLKEFVNLNDYEGYIINLYSSTNGKEYTSALKQ